MLCWTEGAKLNSSIAMNYFIAKSLSFFVTKTFIAKGVARNTVSDETHFIAECDK